MQTTKKDDALLEACVEHDTPETEAGARGSALAVPQGGRG